MVKKLIRQINNLKVWQDTNRPKKGEFYIVSPMGFILEEFSDINAASTYAKSTLDFVKNPNRKAYQDPWR